MSLLRSKKSVEKERHSILLNETVAAVNQLSGHVSVMQDSLDEVLVEKVNEFIKPVLEKMSSLESENKILKASIEELDQKSFSLMKSLLSKLKTLESENNMMKETIDNNDQKNQESIGKLKEKLLCLENQKEELSTHSEYRQKTEQSHEMQNFTGENFQKSMQKIVAPILSSTSEVPSAPSLQTIAQLTQFPGTGLQYPGIIQNPELPSWQPSMPQCNQYPSVINQEVLDRKLDGLQRQFQSMRSSKEKIFKCLHCPKRCSTQFGLSLHQQSMHKRI